LPYLTHVQIRMGNQCSFGGPKGSFGLRYD